MINVAFGRAHLTRKITVSNERASQERFVLNAGGLRLLPQLANGEAINDKAVIYDIYSDERDQYGQRTKLMSAAKPGIVLRLNAGIYNIVGTYGDANAIVRADVTVEAGKLTEATLAHAVAKVTFKLVARAPYTCEVEGVLGVEVVVDDRPGDPRRSRDVLDRGALVALLRKELLGLASGLFGDLHGWSCGLGEPLRGQLSAGLFRQALLVVGRQDLAGDFGRRGNHQPAHFAAQLCQHPGVLGIRGVPRLFHDFPGGRDGFLGFLFLHARGGSARFFNQLGCLDVRLAQNFLALRCGPRQLGLDLVGVGQAFGNALPAFLQHLQDRLVGKALQEKSDDAEADDLRDEMGPVQAELGGGVFGGLHQTAGGKKNRNVHKNCRQATGAESGAASAPGHQGLFTRKRA